MNHNNPQSLSDALLASTALTTYRRRQRRQRLTWLLIILAGLLILLYFAQRTDAAGPIVPTTKPWPPTPPNRYYCQPGNPNPPDYCWRYRIHSRPPAPRTPQPRH